MPFPNSVINGTPVVFSLGSAQGIVLSGISGNITQNLSFDKQTKRVLVMDGNGNRTTSIHTDQIKSVTIDWKVGGTGLANAILQTYLAELGSFIVITSAPNMPELVSANGYEVLKSGIKEGNEEVAVIAIELEQAPNITGLAAA
jgi:hypothetical protein